MSNTIAQKGRRLAIKTLFFQSCVGLFLAVGAAAMINLQSGIYSIVGAGICLIPSGVFAFYAFRYAGARNSKAVANSFRRGSTIKILLTIAMFAIVFSNTNTQVLPVFIGYVVTLAAQWPAIFYFSRATNN